MLGCMRWDHLRLDGAAEDGIAAGEPGADAEGGTTGAAGASRAGAGPGGAAVPLALFGRDVPFALSGHQTQPGQGQEAQHCPGASPAPVARTFDTPGFRGMTFYEVHAKSI